MKVTHITQGLAGLHAENSQELHAAITALTTAGYTVTDIEDDAAEPWHVASVHYTGGASHLRTIKTLVAQS